METRVYQELPEEGRKIRTEVFMVEQGYQNEFDALDRVCTHILAWDQGKALGYIRFDDQTEPGYYHISRVCVLKEYRHRGIAHLLVSAAEGEILMRGGKKVFLLAQEHAVTMYEELGYRAMPGHYEDEGVPHVRMEKDLTE